MAEESSGRNDSSTCTSSSAASASRKSAGENGEDLSKVSVKGETTGAETTSSECKEANKCPERQGDDEDEDDLLFPGFVPKSFIFLKQTNVVRFWCLKLITWPYPFFIMVLLIIELQIRLCCIK